MLACVAIAVAGAVVTLMATVVAARRERGIVAPRVGDAAPLQTAAVVPQSGRNSVSTHHPYPAMYLPWWRFDAPRCTTCRQRLAQSGWMGVSGDGWPNMTRLCMPCYVRYARRPGDTWLIDHS